MAATVHVYVADGSVSFHVVSFARIAEGKIIQLDKYRGDDGPALEWRQKLGNRPQTAFVRQRQSQSVKKVEVQEALLPLNRRGGLLP